VKQFTLIVGLIAILAVVAFFWRHQEREGAPVVADSGSAVDSNSASLAIRAGLAHLRSMADALGCSGEPEFAADFDLIIRESAQNPGELASTHNGHHSLDESMRYRLLSTVPSTFSPRLAVTLLDGRPDLGDCRAFLEQGVSTPEDVVDARRFVHRFDEILITTAKSFGTQRYADVTVDASFRKIHKMVSSLYVHSRVQDGALPRKSPATIPVFSIQEAIRLKQLADFFREHRSVRVAFPEERFHSLYDDLQRHTIPRISTNTLDALLRSVDAERDELVHFYKENNSSKVQPTIQDYRIYADLFRILARQPVLEKYSARDIRSRTGSNGTHACVDMVIFCDGIVGSHLKGAIRAIRASSFWPTIDIAARLG
jgi:hypothetical protein